MIRILAFGDLHAGSGVDYCNGDQRIRDQQDALEQIVDLAIEHRVDVVLNAGDTWHRRRPTPAEILAVARPLRRLRAELGCDMVSIAGNHCVEHADLPIAMELFEDLGDVHRRPGLVQAGGMTVATLPWAPTGKLIATLGGDDRDDLNATAAELLVRAARDLRNQVDGPCVLMLHWSVSGASTPTGLLTDEFGGEVVLDVDALASIGFDAIVAGHIHKAQSFAAEWGWASPADAADVRPPFFYTGSPMPVDFGEASTPHGVWLLDVDADHAEAGFLPVESRPFVTIDLGFAADAEWNLDDAAAALGSAVAIDGAVVRVRYSATEEQARRIDHRAIKETLLDAGAHKVYAIQPTIVRENRARVEHVDDDLTPAAAVAMYADANDLGGDDRAALVADTGRYLNEVGA